MNTPHGAAPPLVTLDPAQHAARFARLPYRIQHTLASHPLLQLPALIELCKRLPGGKVEYNAGDLPLTQDPYATPGNGLSAEETLRRIRECDSWLVLKYVEQDPPYRAVLDACLDEIARHGGADPASYFKRAAFIFVSSPGSMTPLHIDPENNFLLQVAGNKTMSTFDRLDRRVVAERDLERFASGGHRNLSPDPSTLPAPEVHELRPGDGLHVPMHAPHFVRNGSEVSISLSVTFQTRASDTAHAVYWTNAKLRRLGLAPRPPAESPRTSSRDALKYAVFKGLRGVKRALRSRG